jgi:two-component system, OmpR family, response regulator SaeR
MHLFRKNNSAPKTIFLVDDEVLLLDLEEEFLNQAGYQVRKFSDPEEALREFTKSPPALVMTDYWMPRMSGMDLLRECRRLNPQQKVMLVSGTVDADVFADAPVQPDEFVAKPFDPHKLVALVRKLVD